MSNHPDGGRVVVVVGKEVNCNFQHFLVLWRLLKENAIISNIRLRKGKRRRL